MGDEFVHFDWSGVGFFGAKLGRLRVLGERVMLAQAFNRHMADGDHAWGAGLLQVARRHLAYAGSSGVCLAFVWLLGRAE